MTAIDPFTTPAEAEREARAKQAKDFLALAAGVQRVVQSEYDGKAYRYNYANGVEALRDAMVGQGYAMLTVRDELADIAGSLRQLAAMPSAIHCPADQVKAGLEEVGGEIHDLCGKVDQGVEFADSTAAATASISVSTHDLTDAVLQLSEPRPRWWQRRISRTLRQVPESEVSL